MQYRILLFSYNKNIIFFLQIFDFAITIGLQLENHLQQSKGCMDPSNRYINDSKGTGKSLKITLTFCNIFQGKKISRYTSEISFHGIPKWHSTPVWNPRFSEYL
jgi:hypothetical protein